MVEIQVDSSGLVPSWALKQRRLMDEMATAASLFLDKYADLDGGLREHGKLDDDYECFNSWPLLYAIGGDERLLDWSLSAWDGVTRQWTDGLGNTVDREFVKHTDMLHLSEGYVGFQNFGLADPHISRNIDRARRFAGFYLNENPEAPNYDPDLKLIRSPLTGSAGPLFSSDPAYVLNYGHASLHPVIKDLAPGWEYDSTRRAEIQRIYDQVVIRGDIPMNLAVTGLVTHAAILSGDEKYRRWVLDYVEAWIDRTRKNNGIIPDNVGLSGEIGEYRDSQWWGGFFGWSGRYSIHMIFHSLITAVECALLLTGDAGYLELLRSQVDMLLERAITRDGNLLVPYKVGPDGWYDPRPLDPYIVSHLWHASMDAGDWDRLETLRTGASNGPHAYAYAESPDPPEPGAEEWRPDGPADWNHVEDDLHGNRFVENEAPHLRYLAGYNPDWPEAILDATFKQVHRNIERLKGDTYQYPWKSQTLTVQNPVFTAGLGQMAMGAPFPCFNGGMVCARVRYFDPDRRRPGLPESVAALVEQLGADTTTVHLVNVNTERPARVILQAGAYAEHTFTHVSSRSDDDDGRPDPVSVNGSHFSVHLPPASSVRLEAGTQCYVNRPTYAFPWDG